MPDHPRGRRTALRPDHHPAGRTATDITLIVTGVGPNAGSDDPSLQVIYRLGTTLPGWLTSASTRREGIVTLTDLTRTLIDFGAPGGHRSAIDGSPFAVYDAPISHVDGIDAKINSVAALSDAAPIGYLVLGLARCSRCS